MVTKQELFSVKPPKVSLDYETIDGDGHTSGIEPGWYKNYLPEKYWDWAPKSVDGVTHAEGRAFPMPYPLPGVGLGTPSGWKLKDLNEVTPEETQKRGGRDPKDRLKTMTSDGVDIAYLYPTELLVMPWALSSSAPPSVNA